MVSHRHDEDDFDPKLSDPPNPEKSCIEEIEESDDFITGDNSRVKRKRRIM